jgi:tetratricopeptide (TPR) repeat protein
MALRNYEQVLAFFRQMGDKRQLSRALNALAELYRTEGELDKAEPLYEECLALARERGDRGYIAVNLSNLARTSIGRGLGDRARGMLCEGFSIAAEIGSKRAGVYQLECSAWLAAFFSEWECAARFYGANEALQEQFSFHRQPPDEAFLAPLIARTRVALGAVVFAAAESAGRALSYDEVIAEARSWLEQRS